MVQYIAYQSVMVELVLLVHLVQEQVVVTQYFQQ